MKSKLNTEAQIEYLQDEISRKKDRYPYNVLSLMGNELSYERLPRNYIQNTKLLLDTLSIEDEFIAIGLYFYRSCMSEEQIMKENKVSKETIQMGKDRVLKGLKDNQDAIYYGFSHSNLGRSINSEFKKIGLPKSNIDILNKYGIYSLETIVNLKNMEDLLKIFDTGPEMTAELKGTIITNLLHAMYNNGYNTKRFGYFGNDPIPNHITEQDILGPSNKPVVNKEDLHQITEEAPSEVNEIIQLTDSIVGKKIAGTELAHIKQEFSRLWKQQGKIPKRFVTVNDVIASIKGLGYEVMKTIDGGIVVKGQTIYDDIKDSPRVTPDPRIINDDYRYILTTGLTPDIEIGDNIIYGVAKAEITESFAINDPKSIERNFDTYMYIPNSKGDFSAVTYNSTRKRWLHDNSKPGLRLYAQKELNEDSSFQDSRFLQEGISEHRLRKVCNANSIKTAEDVKSEVVIGYGLNCPHCQKFFRISFVGKIRSGTLRLSDGYRSKNKIPMIYICPHCMKKVKIKQVEELNSFL